LHEWGWDLSWNGVTNETIKRRISETFAAFQRPEYSYVKAAVYHNIRDVGGQYGLRDGTGLRPQGVGVFADCRYGLRPAVWRRYASAGGTAGRF
jgi:hypothetical protein